MKIFKKILDDKNLSITIKSISALHIVKYHPLFIEKKKISIFDVAWFIVNFFLKKIFIILQIIKNSFKNKEKIDKKEVLIISHLINNKYVNSTKDFYFGNLEILLKKKKINYTKFMINHTDLSSSNLNYQNKNKNNLILDRYLNLKLEILIIILKLIAKVELIYLLILKKIRFQDFKKLFLSLFDFSTSFALRMHFLIKRYIKKINPKLCIFTYEGYPWERLCINGIKSFNSEIKCIGYQHTPVSKNHHAIFKLIKGYYNPDQIWCSQISSFKILQKNIKKKNYIKFIGSLNIPVFKKVKNKKFKNIRFLVIPEGIYSECKNLFKFSLDLAKKLKKIRFVWRVHPVINLKKVLQSLGLSEKNIPKNIKISNKNFLSDIKTSNFVLYKGSAAVLKAVLSKNYPLYHKLPNEKNFDTLIKYFNKENYCRSHNDVIKILKNVREVNFNKKLNNQIKKIKKDFFVKPNLKKIISYLE